MQERWSIVLPIIDEFRAVLRSDFPPFQVLHVCDQKCSSEEWKAHQKKMRRAFRLGEEDGFIPSRMAGVYLWFDEHSNLFKVGCTVTRFDKRIYKCQQLPVRWIDVIAIPNETSFLAPGLEALLIARLHPPGNRKRF